MRVVTRELSVGGKKWLRLHSEPVFVKPGKRRSKSISTPKTATILRLPWRPSLTIKLAMTFLHLERQARFQTTMRSESYFLGMFSVFPDFHIEAGPLRHGDDHVFVEIRLSGTQHADWAGIPSTGKSFSTRMAVLYEFEEGQLVCERVYMDFADIARQLGSNS